MAADGEISLREPDDVNGRLIESLRDYAATKLGEAAASEAFEAAVTKAGSTTTRATDRSGWVPLSVLHAVAAAYEKRFGPTFITDAFTWAVPRRRDFSAMSLSALSTPAFLFRRIDRARSFYARHLRFSVDIKSRGEAHVRLDYREGVPRTPASCRVALGVLHSVPMLFDLPPSGIKETACYAHGADACTYVVRWRSEPAYAWTLAALGAVVGVLGALLLTPSLAWVLAPLFGWLVGREIRMTRLRRHMTRVSEEHRRALGENELEFQRRFDEISELNEKLEARVKERTRELTDAMAALRDGNAALKRTILEMQTLHTDLVDAGVRGVMGRAVEEFAHELRNPMTILLANVHFLESGDLPSDVTELALVARDIRAGIDRMRAVISWFIELHEGDATSTACLLNEQIAVVVANQSRLLTDRIKVELDLQEIVVAARGKQLMQVIENLLTNAARAMTSGTVVLTSRAHAGRALITVSDDGPGIAPEHLPRIFDRGFTTKPEGQGSGLGLFISRTIVEHHGGTITARSEVGKGTTFEIVLPLYTKRASAALSQRV